MSHVHWAMGNLEFGRSKGDQRLPGLLCSDLDETLSTFTLLLPRTKLKGITVRPILSSKTAYWHSALFIEKRKGSILVS